MAIVPKYVFTSLKQRERGVKVKKEEKKKKTKKKKKKKKSGQRQRNKTTRKTTQVECVGERPQRKNSEGPLKGKLEDSHQHSHGSS